MRESLRSALLWGAAFTIAVALGVFQRMTGPTYPRAVAVPLEAGALELELARVHPGEGGLRVALPAHPDLRGGELLWRRFPTAEEWRLQPLRRNAGGGLEAVIAHQPPAGKVEYRLELDTTGGRLLVPAKQTVVARFRGDVPAGVLVPHILLMFASMLLATSAFLVEVLRRGGGARRRILLAMLTLVVGGLILGPAVQWHAFGAWWTGWPLGSDLTDSKTLLAFLAWLPATVLAVAGRRTRAATILGWLVMVAVFLVPHSLGGSQVDWSTYQKGSPRNPAAVSEVPP